MTDTARQLLDSGATYVILTSATVNPLCSMHSKIVHQTEHGTFFLKIYKIEEWQDDLECLGNFAGSREPSKNILRQNCILDYFLLIILP